MRRHYRALAILEDQAAAHPSGDRHHLDPDLRRQFQCLRPDLHCTGRSGRTEFFDRVSVISVPLREGYAFGLFLLEAMASGIPAVQPEEGAFPEIINATGGGILYPDNDAISLSSSLADLLNNPEKLEELSRNARKGVEERFNIFQTSARMMEIFQNAGNQ